MRVRDCMSENVVTITPEESAALAARLMTRHNLGVLAVCDYHGKLQGVVTDRDIITRCGAVDQDPSRVPVADIMSAQVETIAPEENAQAATERMARKQVRRLPVTEEGRLVGMVSLADLSRRPDYMMEAAEALEDICAGVRHMDGQEL